MRVYYKFLMQYLSYELVSANGGAVWARVGPLGQRLVLGDGRRRGARRAARRVAQRLVEALRRVRAGRYFTLQHNHDVSPHTSLA